MIKTCGVCRQPFRPTDYRRKLCSVKCRNAYNGIRSKGKTPVEAIEASKRLRDQSTREDVRKQFGELSVREIELFKWTYKLAWQRGYNKALHRQPRRK